MKTTLYLCVKKSEHRYDPSFRVTKTAPSLDFNEIAIKLNLQLPDELFEKPTLTASIDVPKEAISSPVIETEVIDNVQDIIKKNTGFEVKLTLVTPKDEDEN